MQAVKFMDLPEYRALGATMFQVPTHMLIGPSRSHRLTVVRYALFKGLVLQGYGIKQVGRWFDFDHSTVRYGVLRANDLMAEDEQYREKVLELSKIGITGKAKRGQPYEKSIPLYNYT